MSVAETERASGARRVDASHSRVLRLAVPMMLAHATTPLLGIVDTAIVGRLGDAALVGGVATACIIFDFVFWTLGFLRMGTAGLTAQALGAGDKAEQRATLVRALVLSTSLGLFLILLQGAIGYAAFRIIDASPAVTEAARAFFEIRIWSAPITLSGYATFGAIIGRGRSDLGLLTQVVINLLNIVINVIFVVWFGWGVRGVAFGAVLAEALGLALNVAILRGLAGPIFGVTRIRVFNGPRFRKMLMLNRDIMLRTALLMFVSVFFLRRGARMDDATLAANAALMNLAMALVALVDGFGSAAEQMCGQSFGARDPNGFRRSAFLCCVWSVATAALITVVSWGLGGFYVDAVTPTPDANAIARAFLPYAAAIPLMGALAFAFDGIFIGAGWARDMRNTMLIATIVYVGLALALESWGNAGLWSAQLIFYVARGAGQMWLYPKRLSASFPEAQSPAATPQPSASRA